MKDPRVVLIVAATLGLTVLGGLLGAMLLTAAGVEVPTVVEDAVKYGIGGLTGLLANTRLTDTPPAP